MKLFNLPKLPRNRILSYLKSSKKNFVLLLGTLFSLLTLITLGIYVNSSKEKFSKSKAVGPVALYLSPSSLSVAPNTSFSIPVKVNPSSEKVSAIELYLGFDKDRLTVDRVDTTSSFPSLLSGPNIDNTSGNISVVIGVGVNPSPVPVGSISDVVIIRARSKNLTGNANISIKQGTRVSAINKDYDVVGSLSGAVISVASSPTFTPTPPLPTSTPTPTPSPAPTTVSGCGIYSRLNCGVVDKCCKWSTSMNRCIKIEGCK